MTRPTSYSVQAFGDMIMDKPRMQAYTQALTRAVFPGCVVLDIGAGTGIFSILACKLGAGEVHTVEPDDSIQVAREIAVANGYSDRIQFHQTLSTELDMATPADVIISDLRGVLPLLQHHIPSIIDARDRLLAPGGHLIPQADKLWATLVESPELYQPHEEPWLQNPYGVDMQAGYKFVINSWRKVNLMHSEKLVEPQHWTTIDYNTVNSPDINEELMWILKREGTCHGMAVWFDAKLDNGFGFSNAPGPIQLVYGQAFFPWEEPVDLQPNDVVSVDIHAKLTDGEYIWQWKTKVLTGGDTQSLKAGFNQSTFHGVPLVFKNLQKQAPDYAPSLDIEGQVDFFILSLMDGQSNLTEISSMAVDRFHNYFKDSRAALKRARELARKYSR